MTTNARSASIFSQKLDRIVYNAYFLGAVVRTERMRRATRKGSMR